MHNPPCQTLREHLIHAIDGLANDEGYDLRVFVDEIIHTFDTERLAADPEFVPGGA